MDKIYMFLATFAHASINTEGRKEIIYAEVPITNKELFKVVKRSEGQYVRDFSVKLLGEAKPCKSPTS